MPNATYLLGTEFQLETANFILFLWEWLSVT